LFEEMQAQGFIRFRVRSGGGTSNEGEAKIYESKTCPKLKKNDKHTIDVVVDRLKVRADMKQRLAESFETALRLADGRAIALEMDGGTSSCSARSSPARSARIRCRNSNRACFRSTIRWARARNATASGRSRSSIRNASSRTRRCRWRLGAVKGWDRRNQFYFQMLQGLAAFYEFDIDTPFEELPGESRTIVLFGSGKQTIPFTYMNERGRPRYANMRSKGSSRAWSAATAKPIRWRCAKSWRSIRTTSPARPAKARGCAPRRACEDRRRRERARRFSKSAVGRCATALSFFMTLRLEGAKREIADRVIKEIVSRLTFLNNVGLDYLSLDRSADTLSGGEAQRIRLASQIGSGPDGRDVCARRTVDRPASARQRPADQDAQASARHRQFGDRGRARRRHDPHGRLRGRHGPGRRRARRRVVVAQGHARSRSRTTRIR
jgi:excinuclease ABC subunit A